MKLYPKSERSTFSYWFAHWRSFNKTAIDLGCWEFKYLFHDIEKPWLKLFWKDYKKVQKYHRYNSNHHLGYKGGPKKIDWKAMTIDWECSRFSKLDAPLDALDTFQIELNRHCNEVELCKEMYTGISFWLLKLGLCTIDELTMVWAEFEKHKCNTCNRENCPIYFKDDILSCIYFKTKN